MLGLRCALALGLALWIGAAAASAQPREDADALERDFHALYDAGKFAEAVPLAQRHAELTKARLGERHLDHAVSLGNLARALRGAERLAEAEAAFRQAIAIEEAQLPQSDPDLNTDRRDFAELLRASGRLAEAEALYRTVLAHDEAALGAGHVTVADDLDGLAHVLQATGRPGEAEPLLRRALAIVEAAAGPDHADTAVRLNNLAALLHAQNRLEEAESLMRRALAISEATEGPQGEMTALRLGNLAQVLVARSRHAEAEPLIRRALAIEEARLGMSDPRVALNLGNLAALMKMTGRLAEAEPLLRRALAIDEAAFGANHPRVAVHLNNLGQVLEAAGRLEEAEPVMRRVLAINEARLDPNDPMLAKSLNNLAQLLKATGRRSETEPLLRRALGIAERNFGPEHPAVAEYLNNLALFLKEDGKTAEAEAMMRRELAIFEQGLGRDHPHLAIALNNLALLLAERGDWGAALAGIRRVSELRSAYIRRNAGGSAEAMRRLAEESIGEFKFHALALYQMHASVPDAANEAFLAAQRALATETAAALAQASARFAAGSGGLAEAVRAAQDTARQRAAADERLLAALAEGDKPAADAARAEEARLDAALDAIAARLARDFPDYAALAAPEPLTIAAVQRLLKPDEALVQFLNLPGFGKIMETGFVWAITKSEVRWAPIGHGTLGLTGWVSVMRCGLDNTSWADASAWPETGPGDKQRKADQLARRQRCLFLTKREAGEQDIPPFSLNAAHTLYLSLFGGIEDVIEGKHLLVVPAGPLTSLPFHTLVTEQPPVDVPEDSAAYARAAWLGQRHAITVLPSASSLEALRRSPRAGSAAQAAYAGFGNPLLVGPYGNDMRAWEKLVCGKSGAEKAVAAMPRAAGGGEERPEASAQLLALSRQVPLPETADELCSVAALLGAPPLAVHLGPQASEAGVRRLSAAGDLGKARVVHFATHGLLAGETQMVTGLAEPALMLTPPEAASAEDDGLLTASEVALLRLDADWVVLSACNTAAAANSDAEALSGLARAFFYAGARALLVSHWYVDSEATVELITRTFLAMKADPGIGRAEALRRAMAGLIAERERAHPSKWAPFVVVGEGAASAH